ncbi:MAG TPA: Stp1/IreP family PP2C-type Ser/Thr phosphatase [Terriglobales bacterium]|jgi:protein phosphatase|nr:Stp1/IreP family PP2C-type Ser/Thr phosphatase [Terriglobales bacterium]
MKVRPGVELASLSDVGCQRENNEDRYSYWEPDNDPQFPQKGRLAIVADGMGGYEGGQEASRIAVEAIEEVYANAVAGEPRSWLLEGFQAAHHRIQEYAEKYPDLHGMGTTCTAMALLDHQLYFAHVGDSRLYLVRGSSISRLTHDHSYVSRLVENGVLRAEEAESHPQRHILTAALGAGSTITPDSPAQPLSLESGDVLVLCTDGLWGLLTEEEIKSSVAGKTAAEICDHLVDTAKRRGGPDNITLQVLRIN